MIDPSKIYGSKILIVGDRQTNVHLLGTMLQDAGYLCVTSTMDPSTVCDLHLKNHYDLILLDLQTPRMDEFQVLEALKKIEPEDYLSVLPSRRSRATGSVPFKPEPRISSAIYPTVRKY